MHLWLVADKEEFECQMADQVAQDRHLQPARRVRSPLSECLYVRPFGESGLVSAAAWDTPIRWNTAGVCHALNKRMANNEVALRGVLHRSRERLGSHATGPSFAPSEVETLRLMDVAYDCLCELYSQERPSIL